MKLLFLALFCAADFWVAPSGDDKAAGSAAQPFLTLERARDAARTAPGATISLQPGIYTRSQTFELTAADSGVTWQGNGMVRLCSGRALNPSDFKPATDPRLDPAARGKVFQLDLVPLGLAHAGPFADVFTGGGNIFDLYFNDRRMPLSRWPNDGFTTIQQVLDKNGRFIAREDRCARWSAERGVWLEGYWRVPWTPINVRLKQIDPAKRELTFVKPVPGLLGSKYAKKGELGDGKEPWYAINLLEELDQPGEWCVDFNTRTLYFWPPGELRDAKIAVADFDKPFVTLKNASRITLRGIVFEGGLGNGVEITGGTNNLIAGCTFRNLGGNGVVVRGGAGHGVRSSDFHTLGQGGIILSGGDRKTLTPAGHFADNNHLHHLGYRQKTYAAGIHVGSYGGGDAVGCRVTHNLIHDLPHAGVLYAGNDHLFEFNEISRVVLTSGDMGAFYTWNDWTSRGNVVRYNFVHDSPRANAFYMDDGDSGDTIFGNVVYRLHYGPFIGGGHDNIVRNNLIIETDRALHLDSRGVSRGYATNRNLVARLQSSNPQQPPWSTRYPTLARLLDGRRDLPTGNLIENNVTVRCSKQVNLSGKKDELQFSVIRDNLDLGTDDPSFVDAAHGDFQLKPGSPVFKKLPAFQPIPFDKIGLYRDEFRTQLPSHAAVSGASGGAVFDSETDLKQSNKPPAQ